MPPTLAGKLLDILGLIPIAKLAKIGKIKKIIDKIRKALDELENLKKAVQAAKKAQLDALEKLAKSGKAKDTVIKMAETKGKKAAEMAMEGFPDKEIKDKGKQIVKDTKKQLEKADKAVADATEDVSKATKELEKAEGAVSGAQALTQEVIKGLADFLLPLDLLKSLVGLLGLELTVAARLPQGTGTINGAYLATATTDLDGEVVMLARGGVPIDAALTEGGCFSFSNLPYGEYQLMVDTDPLYIRRILLTTEEHYEDIDRSSGACITVSVKDNDEPMSDCSVIVCELSRGRVDSIQLAETDYTGCVCLRAGAPDTDVIVLGYLEFPGGYTLLPPVHIQRPSFDVEVSLEVPRHTFETLVTDASGGGLADVVVDLYPTEGETIVTQLAKMNTSRLMTDDAGRGTVRFLTGARQLVVYSKPGYGSEAVFADPSEGGSSTRQVTMRSLDRAGTILGSLKDAEGKESAGYVVLSDAKGQPVGRRCAVGDDGRFRFDGLAPGMYALASQGEFAGTSTLDGIAVAGNCVSEVTLRLTRTRAPFADRVS